MSSAEAAPAASPTAAAAAGAGAATAAPAGDFLQQRLAAIAALPPEQRSHDEAGFLRAHELLAAAEESLATLGSLAAGQSEPGSVEFDNSFCLAALCWLGGLEELCSIGVPLQLALNLHGHALWALVQRAAVLQKRASEVSAQAGLRIFNLVAALAQFYHETALLHEDTPPDWRPEPGAHPSPAALLREQHTQLFGELHSQVLKVCIATVQLTTRCKLPCLAQLQRLWADLCWNWAAQLACGMGRPSWMAGYPGPSQSEARRLQLQALATMRQLRPRHPLTARLAAQTQLSGSDAEPSELEFMRRGLEQAAAAGGPHGSSMFTAELSYGLISSSAPVPGRPPWGCLTLAESVQLLQQGDAALARCKALLPPLYLPSLKSLRRNVWVRWRRAVVQRHLQAGASEWREDLLAAEPAAARLPGQIFSRQAVRVSGSCAGCGSSSVELHSCSACRQAEYCSKACQVKHWPEHKAECKAARAAAAQQQAQQQVQQGPSGDNSGHTS
ncbi:SET domain [Chlorella sorokiniana]|uniref:SET domain n=1 Tax=Chlorella sorokiniana TaxID=3076 RepID=A0A2P6TWT5_CHLSO|nr:SET domain [Chlorella sorokiniana]|eukprot:PRW58525.1 SET domain [Chlorella sorokiniana]